MNKTRGFEEVKNEFIKVNINLVTTTLPIRATAGSGAYDLYSKEYKILERSEIYTFWLDIKVYMQPNEIFNIITRSGNGTKGLIIRNQVGLIDSDYYSNPKNDGNIGVCLENQGSSSVVINIGDRIAQGWFSKILLADNDGFLSSTRTSGHGSTGN